MAEIITTGSYRALYIDTSDDVDAVIYHQDKDGNPVDLTGFVISWSFTIGSVTYTATIGSGLTVDALAGKITLHIPKASLTTFPDGLGQHRLQITNPVDKTLVRGPLTNDT